MPREIDRRTLAVAATLSPMLGLDDVAAAVSIAAKTSNPTKRHPSYFAEARGVVENGLSRGTTLLLALPAFHESVTFAKLLAGRRRVLCQSATGLAAGRLASGDEHELFRAVRTKTYDVVVSFPELRPEFDDQLEAVMILNWRQRLSPLEAIVSHRNYAQVLIGRLNDECLALERFHARDEDFSTTYGSWTSSYGNALASSLRASPGSYASWHELAHRTEASLSRERAMNLGFARAIVRETQRFLSDQGRSLGTRLGEKLQ